MERAGRMPHRVRVALAMLVFFVLVIGFISLVIVQTGAAGLDVMGWLEGLG